MTMIGVKNNTHALLAWYVQDLFGRKGLENFYSSQRECIEQQYPKQHVAPKALQERELSLNLMERVVESYRRLHDSTGACGEAYQDRPRLYACFFDQLTSLRCKFWRKGSTEQRALLQWAEDREVSGPSGRTDRSKPKPSLQQVVWTWLMDQTGQSRSVIDDAVWKGRHVRTMIALFGEGVLYFWDSHLEVE